MAENGGLAWRGGPRRPPWARFLFLRSVQLVTAFWVLATIAVFLIVGADGELPFGERPSLEGVLLAGEMIYGWATLGIALILIGVTFLVTRSRAVPKYGGSRSREDGGTRGDSGVGRLWCVGPVRGPLAR